ncbi:MAG: hypothetical protein JO089_04425 [Alphaproteobacteria bacterium]|nr:hypothetical protein [Alphaproteobacteria bacterium]
MPELRGYDTVLVPAIERSYKGILTLCDQFRASALGGIKPLADAANNAVIDAWKAKTIFDREFRGKEIPDSSEENRKILVVESDHQMRALQAMERHLRQSMEWQKLSRAC